MESILTKKQLQEALKSIGIHVPIRSSEKFEEIRDLIEGALRENPCIIDSEDTTSGDSAKANLEPPLTIGLESAVVVAENSIYHLSTGATICSCINPPPTTTSAFCFLNAVISGQFSNGFEEKRRVL